MHVVLPIEQTVPLAEQTVPLAEQTVPLTEHLVQQSFGLAS